MNEESFISKNTEKWSILESYNKRLVKKGITKFDKDELRSYAELYRMVGHHLAYARTHYGDGKATMYLNQLVGTSHNFFYSTEKKGLFDVWTYFRRDFPAKIRASNKYHIAACLCFMLGFIFSFVLVSLNEHSVSYFFPEELIANVRLDGSPSSWNYPIMSSVIMTNNVRVAFSAVVLGMLAGAGTLYVLFANGLMMGGLTGYILLKGGSMISFWALILPHGFIELGAIFISGGAGLMIGRALLIPGELKRRDALVKSAKEAVGLLPGIILMLIIAGLIEGFITPCPLPDLAKLVFSAVTFVLMAIYFVFS